MGRLIKSAGLLALVLLLSFQTQPSAVAANVSKFATSKAIKWRGGVINVEPLMPFYKRIAFQGIWTSKKGLTSQGKALINALNDAWLDGLEPLDYMAGFPNNANTMRGDQLAGVELFLSEAALRFYRDLYAGRTTPAVSEPDIVIARKKTRFNCIAWVTTKERAPDRT